MRERIQVQDKTVETVGESLKERLAKAISTEGDGSFIGLHEILGSLSEEFDEFKDAVHLNDSEQAIHELKDIATICIWGIASLQTILAYPYPCHVKEKECGTMILDGKNLPNPKSPSSTPDPETIS